MENFPTVLFLVRAFAKLQRERSCFCPRLFRRFVVGCLVSPIPYVGFSLLVYAWWILDRDYGIGPEIGQMTGFLIVAVLFLLAVLIPFVFGLSLILGKRNGRGP